MNILIAPFIAIISATLIVTVHGQEWPPIPVAPTSAECRQLRTFYYDNVKPIRKEFIECMRSPTDFGKAKDCNGSTVNTMWSSCTRRYQPRLCQFDKFWDEIGISCKYQSTYADDMDFVKSRYQDIDNTLRYIDKLKKGYEEAKNIAQALADKDAAANYVIGKLRIYPSLRAKIIANRGDLAIGAGERDEVVAYIFKTGRYALSSVLSNPLVRAIQREALAHIEIQMGKAESRLAELRQKMQ